MGFWYVILGVLIWQTLVMIFYWIFNENDKFYGFSMGIWTPILLIIIKICEKFCKWGYRKYYNCYELYNSNIKCIGYQCIRKSAVKYFKHVYEKGEQVTQPYSIRLLREGKEFKSYPSSLEVLSLKELKNGKKQGMYTKEFLNNFIKEEYKK